MVLSLGSEAAPTGLLDAAEAGAAAAVKEQRHETSAKKIRQAAETAAMASACKEAELDAREQAANKVALKTRTEKISRMHAALMKTSTDAKTARTQADGKAVQRHADSRRTLIQEDATMKVSLARDMHQQISACAQEFVETRMSARNTELAAYKKAEGDAKRLTHQAETAAKEATGDAKAARSERDSEILKAFNKALSKAQDDTAKKKAAAVHTKAACVKLCTKTNPQRKPSAKRAPDDAAFESCASGCSSNERKAMHRADNFKNLQRIKAEGQKQNAEKESQKSLSDKLAALQKKKADDLLKLAGTQNGVKTSATNQRNQAYAAALKQKETCANTAASKYAPALKSQAAKNKKQASDIDKVRDTSLKTHKGDLTHKIEMAAARFKTAKADAERRFRKQTVEAARNKANALAANPACGGAVRR
jgi:hypothetical protein